MDTDTSGERMTAGQYLRNRLISGLFVMVPLWITYVVITTVFKTMASVLNPLVELLPWKLGEGAQFVVSLVAFVVLVLVVGIVASRVVGRRLLAWGEAIILRVPLIKTIYSASKQVIDAVTMPNKKTFKSVAIIDYPRPGLKTLGFVTGVTRTEDGRIWCRVFVPTTPNPTSGFLEFVPAEEVSITDISTEEALKVIISGGFIAPDRMVIRPFRPEDA